MSPVDKLGIELRGYEVAKLTPVGWERVFGYRPTDYALRQAQGDAKWLNERWPDMAYVVRAVVSLDPSALVAPAPKYGEVLPVEPENAPLHLEADEEVPGEP